MRFSGAYVVVVVVVCMAYIGCMWEGNDAGAFGITGSVGGGIEGCGGIAIKLALESNSLSANAFRLRMRSVSGDTYIGYRL